MEINVREPLDNDTERDLAGTSRTEIYSMGHSGRKEPHPTTNLEMKGPEQKPKLTKEEQKKKVSDIIYWRIGLGFAIVFIAIGVVYFIGKGINWGLTKVSGSAPATMYTSELRSNADPSESRPSGPVISNYNMIPAGSADNSGAQSGAGAPAAPSVLGANTASGNLANNCPAYVGPDVYYCEWIDQYTFRPYRTKAEYQAAHTNAGAPVSGSPAAPKPAPVAPYPPSSPQPPANQPAPVSGYLPNGCPAYTGSEYAYCIWIDRYTFQGIRPGQPAPSPGSYNFDDGF